MKRGERRQFDRGPRPDRPRNRRPPPRSTRPSQPGGRDGAEARRGDRDGRDPGRDRAPARGDEPSAAQLKFFEEQVRPLLVEHCQRCHGDQKQKGHLRLDSLASILKGGDGGPAVEPGKPDESLLVEAINYDGLEMPPTGKLDDAQVAVLTRWVAMGAPWPAADRDRPRQATGAAKITDSDRAFWAFRPLSAPAAPVADRDSWSRNPVDRFVFEKLREQGLAPAPEADRRTLIRRASFDLLGLPPSPEEVEAFLADPSPTAYEALIDRMLARPEYGQRWARHWLDLVRYAESDGFRADAYRPDAWRYRDYVVRALNDDKPYDRFVAEQLAGDEIAPDDPEMRVATGFLRLTPYEHNQRDVRGQWSDLLNDLTDVAGEVFLGLGIGCARCHDHKFDPILRDDYYRLRAFFAPIQPRDDLPLATPEEQSGYREELARWEAETAAIRDEIAAIERPVRDAVAKGALDKFPEDIQAVLRKPEAERSPLERQLAGLAYLQVIEEFDKLDAKPEKTSAKFKGDQKARHRGAEEAPGRVRPRQARPARLGADGHRRRPGRPADGDPRRPHRPGDRPRLPDGPRPRPGAGPSAVRIGLDHDAEGDAGPLADPPRQPLDDPRHRQPDLAVSLRPRAGGHVERLRPRGRAPQPSRAARLAGVAVRRRRLELQEHAPADHELGDVPPVVAAVVARGGAPEGPGEPPVRPRRRPPPRRRDGPRCDARRQRRARWPDGRARGGGIFDA